ncbi:hypothetical protein JOD67_002092 [Tenggerimyces flavus]|nr:hypothetical protein [Tenggerimyces flavus]
MSGTVVAIVIALFALGGLAVAGIVLLAFVIAAKRGKRDN